jgi:hypothetical protein
LLVKSEQGGDYSVLTSDSNKLIIYTGSGTSTFSLPVVSSSDVGTHYWFAKTGTGTLIIAAAGSDKIWDSSAGGTIFDSQANETWATLHLILVAANQWAIGGFLGTWSTT